MVFWSSRLLSIAFLFFLKANSQTTITVQVGLPDGFFTPSYVLADVNDIIAFVFSGNMHSVTQSTFENPCLPLQGGFNSGLAGNGINGTNLVPLWNLRITDASQPIWYFCQGVVPKSHCNAGMVGVINPPNISLFDQFHSSALGVSGTPTPTFTVALSGIGAIATASPSDLSTLPPLSGAIETSISTARPTTTIATTSNAATVGGAVGGVLGFLLILVALFWGLERRKLRRLSATRLKEDLVPAKETDPEQLTQSQSEGQVISRNTTFSAFTDTIPSPTHTLSAPPHTRPQFAPDYQQSFSSAAFAHNRTPSEPQSKINTQYLAQEVAAVLRQTPWFMAAIEQRQHAHSGAGSNADAESSRSRPHDGRRLEFHVDNRGDRQQNREYGGLPASHNRNISGPSEEIPTQRER